LTDPNLYSFYDNIDGMQKTLFDTHGVAVPKIQAILDNFEQELAEAENI